MAQRMHAQGRFAAGSRSSDRPQQMAQDKPPQQSQRSRPAAARRRILPALGPAASWPARLRWEAIRAQRAQFYQLPPRLRGPLLEGMQERGPEGYQSMIDAYFRELNKEIK